MSRPLGVAVDLENLREGAHLLTRLLRRLESEDAVVHLVGGRWAQSVVKDDSVPADWTVRRHINGDARDAADDVVHGLLDDWRAEGRVAVVVSCDGDFAASLAGHRDAGVPSFLLATGRPARRLSRVSTVLSLTDVASTDAAADAIEAAR